MTRKPSLPARKRKHIVAVLAFDGVVPFDLATPCEIFGRTRLANGDVPYELRICGQPREVAAGPFRIKTQYGLRALQDVDTLLVPGVSDIDQRPDPAILRAIRAAVERGVRVASLCTGAFLLAAAGVLDGKQATTHWLATDALAARYPKVRVDPNVLYVQDGKLFSSAGAAACLDLCLHLVLRDFGTQVASAVARCSVMPLERPGGQAQFIERPLPAPEQGASLHTLLDWADARLAEPHSLPSLARRAGMSTRSLSRHFRYQLGTTPAKWLLFRRVRRAQELLETTDRTVERITLDVGFTSTTAFREQFRRIVGNSPAKYRSAFRAPPLVS